MGRHRLRMLSEHDLSDETAVGNFISKCIENLEESRPDNPNDSIYMLDLSGRTCMDYIEAGFSKNPKIFVKPFKPIIE